MKPNQFTFFTDSGHGWLKVPIELCRELGLQGKITGYSYCKGQNLYLEEDCDATTFVNAYCSKYNITVDEFVNANKRKYSETSSIRRFYDSIPDDLLSKD